MTKKGRPVSVAPTSRTRVILGWSMIASAWRSASKRAMTCPVSMPGLMTFSATLRRTGFSCSAMKTAPMPPSPIFWSSLYGPIVVPGPSRIVGRSILIVASGTGAGASTGSWPTASSWAFSSDSTWRRSAASSRQARSRYAERSGPAACSRASQKIALRSGSGGFMSAFLRIIGFTTIGPTQTCSVWARKPTRKIVGSGRIPRNELSEQPGTRKSPVTLGGPTDDAQGFSCLVEREPGEETELDQLGASGVDLCEASERFVKVDQIVGRCIVRNKAVEMERLAAPAPTAVRFLAVACAVEQDPPHRLGSSGEKVATTVPGLARIQPDDSRVGFMNKRCGLESLPRIPLRQSPHGEPSQLVVDPRQQVAGRLLIASAESVQNPCHFNALRLDRSRPSLVLAGRRSGLPIGAIPKRTPPARKSVIARG